MATPSGARARILGGSMAGTVAPNTALAAALDQALLAAQHLREALDAATRHQAEVTKQLALTGPCAPRDGVCAAVPPTAPLLAGLSRREAEVLRLLAAGRCNRAIAATLCLSPGTVQRHVANAYLKIGAHNRAEATAYALRHGLA